MTPNELIEFIARLQSVMRTDLAHIEWEVGAYTDSTDHGVRLAWCLAHMAGSFQDLHRDLERLQQELQRGIDADTKIQDKLRGNDIQD